MIVQEGVVTCMNAAGGICRIHRWDLERAVIEKLEYNETRSHRHGGKRA